MTFDPIRLAARPRVGFLISGGLPMLPEPAIKRARAYIDGQNLFHSAKVFTWKEKKMGFGKASGKK